VRPFDTLAIEGGLVLHVMDEPGPGGAHHLYAVDWPLGARPQPGDMGIYHRQLGRVMLPLQRGGVREVGHNGLTNEALLELVAHRLTCFQSGPFACRENAAALIGVQAALAAMYARTAEREARGVEGREVA